MRKLALFLTTSLITMNLYSMNSYNTTFNANTWGGSLNSDSLSLSGEATNFPSKKYKTDFIAKTETINSSIIMYATLTLIEFNKETNYFKYKVELTPVALQKIDIVNGTKEFKSKGKINSANSFDTYISGYFKKDGKQISFKNDDNKFFTLKANGKGGISLSVVKDFTINVDLEN